MNEEINTLQDLVQLTFAKSMSSQSITKMKMLNHFYEESHPCLDRVFHSSADFLIKITAIIDYSLKVQHRLSCFCLKNIVFYENIFIFTGNHRDKKMKKETWIFLTNESKPYIPKLVEYLKSHSPTETRQHNCYIYEVESGILHVHSIKGIGSGTYLRRHL